MKPAFYKTSSNVPFNAPCYIARRADADLFQAIRAGEFCYILDTRQVGKSSLIVHATQRLKEAGVAVAVVELTGLGITSTTVTQWYDALLAKIGAALALEDALDEFWFAHERLAPLPRFMEALRRGGLERLEQPVAIFLDEIDVVRSLPFPTDELFAGIRELYNRRTQDPVLERLTLCLIGVAQPTDLIQDPRITPFNIGRRIELTDFTPEEAAPLAQGLPGEPAQARRLLDRVLYWTGGHPYLTQCLCQAVAEDGQVTRPRGVDRVCEGLFFTVRARDQEKNLNFVAGQLLQPDLDRAALLDRYRQVRERRRLRDDPTDRLIGALRLAGIVRAIEGLLWVRNRIYFRAFDRAWIEANLPDAELRRQKTAYWRGVRRTALAAGVIVAAILGGGLWYWDAYFRPYEEFFNTSAKRWGVMEGVGPLTQEQVRHRNVSYKSIRHGRLHPVEAVEAVDYSGRCTGRNDIGTYFAPSSRWTAQPDQECRWEYVRDSQGQLVYEKAFNAAGRLAWGLVYSPPVKDEPRRAHYVGSDGFPAPQAGMTAEIVEFDYSHEGWEIAHRFFDRSHRLQAGALGAYAILGEYDERGLVRRFMTLDAQGNPMINTLGGAIIEAQYNRLGSVVEGAFFDTGGQPIMGAEGVHKIKYGIDDFGNQVEETFFGTGDEPVLNIAGYHRGVLRYDGLGNIVEIACFDTAGHPVLLSNAGAHRITFAYTEVNNRIDERFFGVDGKPILADNGCHHMIIRYDGARHLIDLACFDTQDRPAINKSDGTHRRVSRYAGNNQIEVVYLDAGNQPTRNEEGYQRRTFVYDKHGRRIGQEDFGFDESKGFAVARSRLDEHGYVVETVYFDAQGRPATHEDGYHRQTARFDDRGNRVEWAYFDVDGHPVVDKTDGTHIMRALYDKRGKQIEGTYFDVKDRPTVQKYGYHKYIAEYDHHGNQTLWAYFDTAGVPAINTLDGFSRKTATYDAQGHLVEIATFDAAGGPIRSNEGFQRRTLFYDERGNKIEQVDYGLDGSQGFTSKRNRYDDRGNLIEWAFFDAEGRPTTHKDGNHKGTAHYDEYGNQTLLAYFDTAGGPAINTLAGFSRKTETYDAQGHLVEIATFDAAGGPIRSFEGFQRRILSYGELGNKIEQVDYGLDGSQGFTSERTRYDGRGNVIEWAYFDTQGRPTRHKDGYHKLTTRYNERGNLIEWAYFDMEGRPTTHKDGNHKGTARYDEHGHQVELAYFDIAGQPTLHTGNGVHRMVWEYDDQGHQTNKSHFGIDGGALQNINEGFTSVHYRYDSQGRQIEEAFFGSDGNPSRVRVRNPLGYTVGKTEYGPDGSQKKILLGFDPVVWGYETMIQETDHIQCLDRGGKPVKTQLVVTMVLPGSQAERLGVRVGDVLTHYAGEAIGGDFLAFIKRRAAEPADGPPRVLRVWREGKALSFTVKPGKLGLGLQDRGVTVTGTSKASPSATTGGDRQRR